MLILLTNIATMTNLVMRETLTIEKDGVYFFTFAVKKVRQLSP